MLLELAYSAMQEPGFEVDLEPIEPSVWHAFGVPPTPTFRLTVPSQRALATTRARPVLHPLGITATALASLSGWVRTPDGIPIAGARVEVPAIDRRSRTDADGRFRLDSIPSAATALRVRVTAKGHEAWATVGAADDRTSVVIRRSNQGRYGMPEYLTPDVYVEEVPAGPRPIQAVGTRTAGFVGRRRRRRRARRRGFAVNNWTQFMREYVGTRAARARRSRTPSSGSSRTAAAAASSSTPPRPGLDRRRAPTVAGSQALEAEDEVAIVAAPGWTDAACYDALLTHCETLKDRVAILDAPLRSTTSASSPRSPRRTCRAVAAPMPALPATRGRDRRRDDAGAQAGLGRATRTAATAPFYFPGIATARPARAASSSTSPPSGHVAGIWARTDSLRGVHKAPANELVRGALNVTQRLTFEEQGVLNPAGRQLHPLLPARGHPRVGRPHARRRRERVALPERPPPLQHDRGVDRRGHALDRLRAQRPDPVEVDPARRRRVPHAGVARRRAHGPHAAGGVLRQVRRGDEPAGQHRRRASSSRSSASRR